MGNDRLTVMSAGTSKRLHAALVAAFIVVLVWSVIRPYDLFTWFLEVLPAAVGLVVLLATYRRFRFSDLAYFLMWVQALILVVGGHYTYAEMPLFNWIRDAFDLTRNHYDRVGHFAQGFVPAIITRELLLRTSPLRPGKWLFTLVTSVCLAISATYEFGEWLTALLTGTKADAFLGTQGDIWDTQWDMFLAFIGAMAAQLALSKVHDRSMDRTVQTGRTTRRA